MNVRMPDGTIIKNVPEGTTKEQLLAKLGGRGGVKQAQAAPAEVAPANAIGEAQANPEASLLGMNFKGETDSGFSPAAAIIGAGRLGDKLNQGYQQAKTAVNYALQSLPGRIVPGLSGGGQESLDQLMAQKASEAEKDRQFAKLETVHPGSTQIGQIAPLLPLGPEALLTAAATEYGSPGERATRVAATVVGNKLAKTAGASAASKVDNMAASKATNAVRDANVAAAKEAGYAAIPSEVGGSMPGRILEGLSGKEKTGQLASVKNQSVTDALARKAFGLPEGAPLTLETMRAVRAGAFENGYAPVKSLDGLIKTDSKFRTEISGLTSRADSASQAFGDVVKSDLSSLVEGMTKAKPFTPAQGIDTIAILREKASGFYAKGDKDIGRAYKEAASALEGQIERFLSKQGKDGAALLKGYRDARQTMAKSFDAEKAINSGRDGMVNAQALAKILKKSPDRLTGDLRTIAEAATSMPKATLIPQQGWSSPVTAFDSWGSMIASAAAGNPAPLAFPAARVGARYGVLSKPGQAAFTKPSYDPSLLLRGERKLLENQFAPQAGGLLGYYFANR